MTLEDTMRQLLAEMTLIQYGNTTSWNKSGGDAERDPRPSGDSRPLADEWRDRWLRAPTQETVDAARAALDAVRRRQVTADGDDSTEDDWIVDDGEGYEVEQVARKFNTTPARVRKLRMANDRDTEFGLPTRFARRPTPRVQDLVEQGLGARQIEMLTGVKRSTAQDAINRHRKAA